jgi:hypothetical protein
MKISKQIVSIFTSLHLFHLNFFLVQSPPNYKIIIICKRTIQQNKIKFAITSTLAKHDRHNIDKSVQYDRYDCNHYYHLQRRDVCRPKRRSDAPPIRARQRRALSHWQSAFRYTCKTIYCAQNFDVYYEDCVSVVEVHSFHNGNYKLKDIFKKNENFHNITREISVKLL